MTTNVDERIGSDLLVDDERRARISAKGFVVFDVSMSSA
jgi:hypothetical protein